jgi:TolB-like protein/Tfp pilus assembly protein PilF
MPKPPDHPLRRLIREIHRRSIWQVLGIYLAGSWIAWQAAVLLEGDAGLPSWFSTLALGLLILGLPIVLATAFVQEGGPGHHDGEDEVAIGEGEGVSAETSGRTIRAPHPAPGEGHPSPSVRFFTWRRAFFGGVGAFALLGFVGTAWVIFGGAVGPGASGGDGAVPISVDPSIAVLRFDDLSPGGDQQYFVEGLSEEIINALAQIVGLKVSARTSTFTFQDLGLDVSAIADSLGVANILEGSVRRDGDQIRITAQLIEAETGFHLWSDNYDRELTAIFAIQDEIATNIADHLQLTLTGEQAEALVQGGTESTQAHEAYLLGRSFWTRRTFDGLDAAIVEFERAISLDPEYAEAYSGLADSYSVMEIYVDPFTFDVRAAAESALEAAGRAVELAPDLGMVHASLGRALIAAGRWDDAETSLDRALALSPGYAAAHYWKGLLFYNTGRQAEAQSSLVRARELDPSAFAVAGILWASYAASGQWEEGEAEVRRAVALDPTNPVSWQYLGWLLFQTERYEEAIDAWVRAEQFVPLGQRIPAPEAFNADLVSAQRRFMETDEPQPFTPAIAAAVAAAPILGVIAGVATGQSDLLLPALESLIDVGAYSAAAGMYQTFAATVLRDDPRTQALLAEMGIEP